MTQYPKYNLAGAVLIVAGLILAGCSVDEPNTGTPGGQASTTTSAPAGTATTSEPPEETTPESPTVAKIGPTHWFTYTDGLRVQVTKVARTTKGVMVTVTIRNGTKKTIDLSASLVNMTYGPDGNPAEQVFDMDFGLGFTGTLPPDRSKTARFAFTVPRNQTIDIEVSPGFLDYESCHFEGSVK